MQDKKPLIKISNLSKSYGDLLVLNELNNNENFESLKDKYINFINKNVLYMAKKEKE